MNVGDLLRRHSNYHPPLEVIERIQRSETENEQTQRELDALEHNQRVLARKLQRQITDTVEKERRP